MIRIFDPHTCIIRYKEQVTAEEAEYLAEKMRVAFLYKQKEELAACLDADNEFQKRKWEELPNLFSHVAL